MGEKHKIDRLPDEWVNETLNTELGSAVSEMLMRYFPWQTFSTLTTAHICAPERMKKLIFKTFGLHRPMRGCEYFWVLEPFKERGGVHAHVLSRNEPPEHLWRKTWNWYKNKKGWGRFESLPLRQAPGRILPVAAYITKYCSKELREAQWGFSDTITGGQTHSVNRDEIVKRSGSDMRGVRNVDLSRDQANWNAGKWNQPHRNRLYKRESEGLKGRYTKEAWEELRARVGEATV